jgi:hypothetical protein
MDRPVVLEGKNRVERQTRAERAALPAETPVQSGGVRSQGAGPEERLGGQEEIS